MPVLALTQEFIDKGLIAEPGKKRTEYCDKLVPGLFIEVRSVSPGKGTWYLRYKNVLGKTAYAHIGHTDKILLVEARKAAKKLKADISLGTDPREEIKAEKATLTFGEFLWERYYPYILPRKRSARIDEQMMRLRIVPQLGHFRLNQLTPSIIQKFHSGVREEGLAPATADLHLRLIHFALGLAVDWELVDRNVSRRVKLFRVYNRVEYYLNDENMERFLEILKTDSNRSICNLALFLLSTGARLNEALKTKWTDIDFDNRLWRIPATNSKSKKVRSVPLNDTAIEALHQLGTRDKYEWVFVNRRKGEKLTYVHKVWDRIRKKAELPKLRLHDL